MKTKYKIAKHRGSLKDCLKTERILNKKYAERLLKTNILWKYCYDDRINAERYLINYAILNNCLFEIQNDKILQEAILKIQGYDWLNIYKLST